MWVRQFRRLREASPFYSRKFREAGLGSSFVGLADLARLPFTKKDELKAAIDQDPHFGTNLCVEPNPVKLIYPTRGTSGSPKPIALAPADIDTGSIMRTG